MCKQCCKEQVDAYYQNHKVRRKGEITKRKKEISDIVSDLKRKSPCADCKQFYNPWQMDYDHREGSTKLYHVSGLINYGNLEAVLTEIAKCDLVCSNCHRNRTHERRAE